MKKQPQRQCVSCKERKDKKDLLRIVAMPDGSLAYDPTGKLPGRGSYLCRSSDCIKAELKKASKLSKGLRRPVTKEEIDLLAEEILKQAEAQ